MIAQIVRGPLLVPREKGRVAFYADGALACDEHGMLVFVGAYAQLASEMQKTTPLPSRECGRQSLDRGLGEGASDNPQAGAPISSSDPHPNPLPQAGEGTGKQRLV